MSCLTGRIYIGDVPPFFLKQAKEGTIFHKIFEQRLEGKPQNLFNSAEEIVTALVNSPKTLFYGDISDVMGAAAAEGAQGRLRIYKIKEGLRFQQSILFPKDSEFREIFNHNLMKLKESGLLRQLYKKFIPGAFKETGLFAEAEAVEAAGASPISIQGVILPFITLASMAMVAVVVCCLENIAKHQCDVRAKYLVHFTTRSLSL